MADGSTTSKLHKDLLLACGWGKEVDVILLLQQGASVKVQDQNGRNCLHYASTKGHTNIVEILLLKKCNANSKDKFGSTPLHQAAVNGHTECASTLIEGGANLNNQDENGNTPLYEAVWSNYFEITDLFLSNEADVNIRNKEGYAPLHIACQNNNVRIVQNLIKWGANIQSPIKNGNTPLHISVENSQTEAVKALLNLDADINSQNHDGNTPLHLCAELGDYKLAKILLECGQPYEASLNNVGDTAKDIAIRLGHKEFAEVIPTPMLARKLAKKIDNKIPRSPKRTQKHRTPTKTKEERDESKNEERDNVDSQEKPVQVIVQPPSVDNVLASDTDSSLSSQWLPVHDSGSKLPMDVHWSKCASPSTERKIINLEKLNDVATLKELRKCEQNSHSDGSATNQPRYQIRKKRRKHVTSTPVTKQKGVEDWVEESMRESMKVPSVKSPKFKKKKHGSMKKFHGKKLAKVIEQGEEEASIASPPVHRKEIDDSLIPSSPRVKGRAEMKKDHLKKSKEIADSNGHVHIKQIGEHSSKHSKKGLKEYFIDSMQIRKSPAGTEADGSWTQGTLEHKKNKDFSREETEFKKHMKLTERDIEALIKNDSLGRIKGGKEPKKSSKGYKKNLLEDSESEQEIVVIRLDPNLETPKKQRRAREKIEKIPERISRKKVDAEIKHDKSFAKNDAIENKFAKQKQIPMLSAEKKEEKMNHKNWPKFEVNKSKKCEEEPGTSAGVSAASPQLPECSGTLEKIHRHNKKSRPDTTTSKHSILDKIHKLEKRFKQFLSLTAEKLEEQKESDNKHYNTLKNNLSSMERNLEFTTKQGAIDIIESLTNELNTTMRKWTNILWQETHDANAVPMPDGRDERGCARKGDHSHNSCSTNKETGSHHICGMNGIDVQKDTCSENKDYTDKGGGYYAGCNTSKRNKKLSSSCSSRSSGYDIIQSCDKDADDVRKRLEKTRVENTSGQEQEFAGSREHRAAPLGRSDESSPGPHSRYSGDGDHMTLEKWYEDQLKEAERRWERKATAEQEALKNRIKELEGLLFQYTGVHSTMV